MFVHRCQRNRVHSYGQQKCIEGEVYEKDETIYGICIVGGYDDDNVFSILQNDSAICGKGKTRDNTDVWQAHLQRVFAIHPFYIYNEWQDGHRMWIEEKEV